MKKDAFMTRSFLPVGQGAFYCEHFESNPGDRINIVYDCGSTTDLAALIDIINNTFDENEEIEAVFISHFDEDHVNGLENLFVRCHVKNIFLPVVTPMIRSIIELGLSINGGAYNNSLMNDPYYVISGFPNSDETNIFVVRPTDDVGGDEEDQVNSNYLSGFWESGPNMEGVEYINSGTDIWDSIIGIKSSLTVDWDLVPFNFRNISNYSKLMKAVANEYKRTINPDDLLDLYHRDPLARDKITMIYKSVFPGASANINSMTLFSGPADADSFCQEDMYSYRSFDRKRPGCLYLGDYDASGTQKWKQLRKNYDKYWDDIGCLQVPHHGSSHNFNTELLTSTDAFYIISAGLSNRYKHPHAAVMREFMAKGIAPHLVTEMPGTAYYTYCRFE